jgi:transcriptional regulator with XRE-family HTH domain
MTAVQSNLAGRMAGPFSAELTRAMTKNAISIKALAKMTGINAQTISNLRRGINSPRPQTAALLADALHWDTLAQMTERARRRECPVCGRNYVTQHTDARRMRFCSRQCQQVDWRRNSPNGDVRKRAKYEKKTTMLLREYQAAVDAFCRSCESVDLICRDSGCDLRPLSPLPLIQLSRRAAA